MGEPLAVEILSDEDGISPFPSSNYKHKKARIVGGETPILIIDDDVTPMKSFISPTPFIVPETPLSAPMEGGASIVKCSMTTCSVPRSHPAPETFEGPICLELISDNESDGGSRRVENEEKENANVNFGMRKNLEANFSLCRNSLVEDKDCDNQIGMFTTAEMVLQDSDTEQFKSLNGSAKNFSAFVDVPSKSDLEMKDGNFQFQSSPLDGAAAPDNHLQETTDAIQIIGDSPLRDGHFAEDVIHQIHVKCGEEKNVTLEQIVDPPKKKAKSKEATMKQKRDVNEAMLRREKMKEEKKLKREQDKIRKEAMKAEAIALKKLQKEKEKWEKGKFALKSIVAEIDKRVIEVGLIGGHLLTRFAEKGLAFRVTSNPMEKSILWKLDVPDEMSEVTLKRPEVPYVLLVYEADEFCNLVINNILEDHIATVQSKFPTYTVCILTNRLMAYINKREQAHYKNPSISWKKPPVDEVLAKLAIDFIKVHSRQCRDEAELAEHVVGLTCSLATCQFRKKMTHLSVHANGSLIPKDFVDKNLIKKSTWLKALIAIPKVQPRFAVAIWKKYPTMRSLLNEYMDPSKSVHEKEFLLKDLMTEGLLGQEERRVGEICSKRVYRVLTARSGNIKTDDVEDGADFFDS